MFIKAVSEMEWPFFDFGFVPVLLNPLKKGKVLHTIFTSFK